MEIKIEDFLRKTVVDDVVYLINSKRYYSALVILSQTIETLGAFIDNKPFRAKMQSKKRFGLALKYLFPKNYKRANNDFFLYNKLRNQIAHILVPSTLINIIEYTKVNNEHMTSNKEGILFISVTQFYNDVVLAINKLEEKFMSGELKTKIITINFEL